MYPVARISVFLSLLPLPKVDGDETAIARGDIKGDWEAGIGWNVAQLNSLQDWRGTPLFINRKSDPRSHAGAADVDHTEAIAIASLADYSLFSHFLCTSLVTERTFAAL
jgi:hypothetical protein